MTSIFYLESMSRNRLATKISFKNKCMSCFYGKLHAIILSSDERVFMPYITNTFRCLLWYSVFLSLSQPIFASLGRSCQVQELAYISHKLRFTLWVMSVSTYVRELVSSCFIDKTRNKATSRN